MTTKRSNRTERLADRFAERTTRDPAGEDAGDSGATLAETDSAQGDADLAELGVQLPDGAMGTLYRLLEGGDKEFIDETPVAGFTVAGVAARYGGGRYILYLKKPHPEVAGKWFKAGSKPFRIAGPSRSNVLAGADAAPAVGTGPGIVELEKLTRLYGESIQASVKSSIDNAQLLQQMQLAVVKSLADTRPATPAGPTITEILMLIDKMGGRNSGPSITDVIALADKMATRNSPSSQLKETMELMAAARELGGGESGPAWIPIAAKALDVFTSATGYTAKPLLSGTTAQPETILAPVPVEVSTVTDATHPLLKWLAPQIPGLVAHAQADHDPETYAGVLVDSIPAQHWPDVLAFLQAPDFLSQLQATFPVMLPLQAWFSELRDRIVERLQDLLAPPVDGSTPELVP